MGPSIHAVIVAKPNLLRLQKVCSESTLWPWMPGETSLRRKGCGPVHPCSHHGQTKPSEAFRRLVLSQCCVHGCQSKPVRGLKGCGPVHPCCHRGQTKPSVAFRRFVLSHHCGHGCQSKPFGGLKVRGLVHPCCHHGQTKPSEAFRRFVLSHYCGHGCQSKPLW